MNPPNSKLKLLPLSYKGHYHNINPGGNITKTNYLIAESLNLRWSLPLKRVLARVQEDLHSHNPFIRDFKQIAEMSEEQLSHGKIVISAKKRPSGEHERRYNEQLNLKEVSILTNSQPHDLVLHQRGGGLQVISELNPKGMPLHFTLLFPHGTPGWDSETKQFGGEGKRRITTREFYAFYLNVRDPTRDYLH